MADAIDTETIETEVKWETEQADKEQAERSYWAERDVVTA